MKATPYNGWPYPNTPADEATIPSHVEGFILPIDAAVAQLQATVGISSGSDFELSLKNLSDEIKNRLPYRVIRSGANLDDFTATEDILFASLTGVTNAPAASIGLVEVRNAGGNISQRWRSLVNPLSYMWVRRKAGSRAWTPWIQDSYIGMAPPSSVSISDIREVAVYPIQSVTHEALPITKVGTLRVEPASGELIQTYVTWEPVPQIYQRSSRNATEWNDWVRQVNRSEIDAINHRFDALPASAPTGSASDDFSTPYRAPLDSASFPSATVSTKPYSDIPQALSSDRLTAWSVGGAALRETSDYGANWVSLRDENGANPFAGTMTESVVQLDNGELMITNYSAAASRRSVWVTEGYKPGSLGKVVRTLEARAPMIKFTSAWSQSNYQSIVLINEYGPKTGMLWTGQEVKPEENARYTYLSTDYGRTWRTIFDLNKYLKESQNHATTDLQHLHGVAWDPYWDRIWVSFGDGMGGAGSNGIVYSDDMGETWNTAHYYKGSTPPHQVVGIQPMPQCVLFYGDMGPDVIRIDRSQGKYKPGGYKTVVAFNSSANGKHLCQGFTRVRRAGDDAPALAVFSAEGEASPSFAIYTMDGFTFHEIWRDDQNQSAGMGGRSIIGPTLTGKVIISSNDLKVSGSWSEIVLPAPGY